MIVNPEHKTTLLLNNAWQPITTVSAKAAFMHLIRGNIVALDSNNSLFHTFESWNNNASFHVYQPIMRSSTDSWRIPTVIVVSTKFFRKPKKKKLSLYELAKMHEHVCQYCLEKFSINDLTIDHIKPRSLGGLDNHENRTLACRSCNTKKSSNTPWLNIKGEIPKAPEIPFLMINMNKIRKEWEYFL